MAALAVALCHIGWMHPLYQWGLVRNAYLMVDFFFVLSGFVICHSYGERIATASDGARFVWLRLARLYPLHLTFLLVMLAIELTRFVAALRFGHVAHRPAFSENTPAALASNLLLIHSLGLHDRLTYNYPSWSISTEFFTYVLFALVLLVTGTRRTVLATSVALIVGSVGVLVSSSGSGLNVTYDLGFFRCVAGFFLGVVTFHIHRTRPLRAHPNAGAIRSTVIVTLIAGIGLFLSIKNGSGQDDYLILPLVAALILAVAATPGGAAAAVLSSRPLAWLGKVSYSAYMVHAAVLWVFGQALRLILQTPSVVPDGTEEAVLTPSPTVGALAAGAAVMTILAVSHLTYQWIEDPCRRKARAWVERRFPRHREVPAHSHSIVAGGFELTS